MDKIAIPSGRSDKSDLLDKKLICQQFLYDPDINPESGKTIKIGGPTFKKLVGWCRELNYDKDVDILLEALDLQNFKNKNMIRGRSRSPIRAQSEQIKILNRSPIRTRAMTKTSNTTAIPKPQQTVRSRSPETVRSRSPETIRSPDRIINRSPERIISRSPERITSRSRSPVNYGLTGNRSYDKDVVLNTDLKTLVKLYHENKRSIRKTVRDVLPQIIKNNTLAKYELSDPVVVFLYDLLLIGEYDLVIEAIKLLESDIYDLLAYKIGCDNISLLAKLFKMAPQNHQWYEYSNLLDETEFFSYHPNNNRYDDLISLKCQTNVLDAAIMARNENAIKTILFRNGWGFKDHRDVWQLDLMNKKGYDTSKMIELVKRAEKLVKSS